MAQHDEEPQDANEEPTTEPSESLIGDDDDLFGEEGAADEPEALDKNGRFADDDEDEKDEDDEEDGVDFDAM
jgi:hypothetical protein